MNKIPLIFFFAFFFSLTSSPSSASFLELATLDDLPKHFRVHKALSIPDIQVDYASSGFGQTLVIVKDHEFDAVLLNNRQFKSLMELPKIPLTPIQGCRERFLRSGLEIQEKKQGQATFIPTTAPRTSPHYMGSTSIFNCVGVVLDQFQTHPHQGGFMHVDEQEFNSGRFGRLLDTFNAQNRPYTKVTLTSCFFSPLLERVSEMLVQKGFRITQTDVTRAYLNKTLRIVPLSMTGMTMEQALLCENCNNLYDNKAVAAQGPKMVLYDFASHCHHHMGYEMANDNDKALYVYFNFIKPQRILTQTPPVQESANAMGRMPATIQVGMDLQAILETASQLPQDQLKALCDVLHRIGQTDLATSLSKR